MPELSYKSGVSLVIIAGLLWSGMGLAIRQIEVAGTWQILFYRSLGLGPVLFLLLAWRSGGRPMARLMGVGWAGVIGGLGLVIAFSGAIFAIQTTTVANAVFLFAASPFITALLSWVILRETVRRATWGAIVVAAIGMLIMVREGLAAGAMAGNAAALLSALGFAAFTITLRWGRLADMLPAVLLGAVFSILAAFAVTLARGESLALPMHDILISMGMGILLLGVGMVLYTLGSRVVPAAELTLLSMIEVLMAPVWVWLAHGETASSGTFVGGAILMLAIVGNALTGMRRKPAPVQIL